MPTPSLDAASKIILSWGGLGFLPKAPGTWGTVGGVAVAVLVVHFTGYGGLAVATVLATIVGWAVLTRAFQLPNTTDLDPGWVVIDEVAGVWLTLLFLLLLPSEVRKDFETVGWIAAFILFRLFDIAKPFPINLVDARIKSAWGVMFDDLVAGVMAGVSLVLIAYLWRAVA
ncbi:MAG: phosphatidylglycerophosphatase A [Alphaproteobacteria bacterium]|nr:phosphatidylglycerophosphatase A [Alphaproteobacteria bacterium]